MYLPDPSVRGFLTYITDVHLAVVCVFSNLFADAFKVECSISSVNAHTFPFFGAADCELLSCSLSEKANSDGSRSGDDPSCVGDV